MIEENKQLEHQLHEENKQLYQPFKEESGSKTIHGN